jgi:hypothetical protein
MLLERLIPTTQVIERFLMCGDPHGKDGIEQLVSDHVSLPVANRPSGLGMPPAVQGGPRFADQAKAAVSRKIMTQTFSEQPYASAPRRVGRFGFFRPHASLPFFSVAFAHRVGEAFWAIYLRRSSGILSFRLLPALTVNLLAVRRTSSAATHH